MISEYDPACLVDGRLPDELDEHDEARIAMDQQRLQSRAIKRSQVPQDLVGTVIVLCSADSDFMTGQTLVVDGGAQMH